MTYSYWGFGLHIASALRLPELLPAAHEQADVTIELHAGSPEMRDAWEYRFDMDTLVHHVPQVATFVANSGSRITVSAAAGADPGELRFHLFASVLPGLLAQRRFIALHASALLRDDRLVVIAGHSGAGKSTTATRLYEQGHRVFTDDVCILRQSLDEAGIRGVAGYPVVKLWDDNGVKRHHYIHSEFDIAAYPIAAVIILGIDDRVETATLRDLNGTEAFSRPEDVIYWKQLIVNLEMRHKLFASLASVARETRVFELLRPRGRDTIAAVADCVARACSTL